MPSPRLGLHSSRGLRIMDSFLNKFSLHHFLRQMFCGVVFFVPLFMYVPEVVNAFLCELVSEWRLSVVIVLSCIVGTIIYHLEKNFYSYMLQRVFEIIYQCRGYHFICILSWLICSFFILVWSWSPDKCVFHWLGCFFILGIVGLLSFLCHWDRSHVINRTEQCWMIEDGICNTTERQRAIAKKIATWADFIHCTQSCCIAWICGTALTYNINPEMAYCASSAICVRICVAVMLFEILVDWHRYQHVIKITTGEMARFPDDPKNNIEIYVEEE